jgi:hypothetical protein
MLLMTDADCYDNRGDYNDSESCASSEGDRFDYDHCWTFPFQSRDVKLCAIHSHDWTGAAGGLRLPGQRAC